MFENLLTRATVSTLPAADKQNELKQSINNNPTLQHLSLTEF